ncbi:MAG TPA: hypothetical protein VHE81_12880 [Lacipirellulaceae bacterium]|nr:hypothetical protein [Lacipirellulaceae bacterium]
MNDRTESLAAPTFTHSARLRWGVYLLLIAVAVGNMTGRLLSVNSVDKVQLEAARIKDRLDSDRRRLIDQGITGQQLDAQLADREAKLRDELRLQRPFLSANDRSRWMTVRSLVEHGTYEIDSIVGQPTWDTIDMVQHLGRDGKPHLYSSKPPLLATLIAGEYWLIHRVTGATLGDHPYAIGRFMLFTINVLPLALMFVLLARLAERFGATDWGKIFVVGAATMGTFLDTFAVVLNNHVIAAVCAAVAIYAAVRILADGERRLRYFALAGFAATFTASDELPALTLLAFLGFWLLWRVPRRTLLAFVPAAAVVAAAFFATNWIAHASLLPPYMHRSSTNASDNWYDYTYTVNGRQVQSYWQNRQGIDRGEPSKLTYALNVLVGHHGIFSLTPVWLLSIAGAWFWLRSPDPIRRELAAGFALVTLICLVFYIGLRPLEDRNYGGMTSGFRWMFWCAPLWIVLMIPAADRLARSFAGQALAAVLLSFSVLSASYPTWDPWVHPWIYNWMVWCGGPGF